MRFNNLGELSNKHNYSESSNSLESSDSDFELFPDDLYNINLNLYGIDYEITLKDVLILTEGINFEMCLLADRTAEQMDKTLEKIASYRLSIATAVDQINELVFELSREVDDLYSSLREFAQESIKAARLKELELGERTKSTIGNLTNLDIDSFIRNMRDRYDVNEKYLGIFQDYRKKEKELSLLKSKREFLEKTENILLNRSKELISILDRRMGKFKQRKGDQQW